ncbi:MAG: hypothetical protein ACKOY8_04730 [Verrucomicrobiota bacterium]
MSRRLLALLTFVAPLCAAEPPATLLAQPEKALVVDALTKDAEAAAWKVAKGKWERTAEGIRVEELPEDKHGAVSRLTQKLDGLVIAFEFRLDGAKSVSLSINAEKDHMARVAVTPTTLRIQRDDNDHEGPDKAVAFLTAAQAFEAGTWHKVVLEMVGDTLVATVDGKISGFGRSELFRTPKVNPGFTCSGQSATFRNFSLWSAKAEPKASWKETAEKVAADMAAMPKPAPVAAKGKAAAKKKAAKKAS